MLDFVACTSINCLELWISIKLLHLILDFYVPLADSGLLAGSKSDSEDLDSCGLSDLGKSLFNH